MLLSSLKSLDREVNLQCKRGSSASTSLLQLILFSHRRRRRLCWLLLRFTTKHGNRKEVAPPPSRQVFRSRHISFGAFQQVCNQQLFKDEDDRVIYANHPHLLNTPNFIHYLFYYQNISVSQFLSVINHHIHVFDATEIENILQHSEPTNYLRLETDLLPDKWAGENGNLESPSLMHIYAIILFHFHFLKRSLFC